MVARPYIAIPVAPKPLAWDIRGCAAPYERWSRDEYDSLALHRGRRLWYDPHAFTDALARGDARLQIDHRDELQVATQADGSLRFTESAGALWFEANLSAPLARLVIEAVSEGTVTGMCVMAYLGDATYTETEGRIHRIERFDLSLMVHGFSCFYESSVQVNRLHRGLLRQKKDRIYAAMWDTVPDDVRERARRTAATA